MKSLFLYPGDKIRLKKNCDIGNTKKKLENTSEFVLEDSEIFLKNIESIPRGTELEISQIYVKDRANPSNGITFKVTGGTFLPNYNNHILKNEIAKLTKSIDEIREKINKLKENDPYIKDLNFDIKNREKRLALLSKQKAKTMVSSKLIKINLEDIELWNFEILGLVDQKDETL